MTASDQHEPEEVAVTAAAPTGAEGQTATVAAPGPLRRFLGRVESPFVIGFLLTLGGLAAFAVGIAVTNLSTVLIYIAFAMFIALGIDPVVRWLQGRGLKRTWSIVVTFAALAAVCAGILLLIVPTVVEQVSQFVQSIPTMIRDFTQTELFATLEERFGDGFQSMLADIQKFLTNPGNIAAIGGGALQVGATIFTAISGIVIVLVLTLYFVATLPQIKQSMNSLAPARSRARAADLTDQITDSIGAYLGGMVVLAAMNAVFAGIVYAILGLPFPLLMSVVAFAITLIPLIGSVLFWAVASGLALFTSPLTALIFAIVYLIYMQLEAYVLTPRVMNRAIAIPGSLVVIGALAGGTLLGLLGALIAIPVTASLLLIVKQLWIPKQDAKV